MWGILPLLQSIYSVDSSSSYELTVTVVMPQVCVLVGI